MAKKVIIATNNAHKVEEISDFFSALDWECESLAQAGIESNPDETGTTLIENCLLYTSPSPMVHRGSIRRAMQEKRETIKRTICSCLRISHRLDLKTVQLTFPVCCASSTKTEPRPLQKAGLKA